MKEKLLKYSRFIPILGLATTVFLFFWFGGFKYFQVDHLRQVYVELKEIILTYPFLSTLVLMGIYSIYTMSSIPGLLCVELVIGFCFPQPLSLLVALAGAAIGSTILYWAIYFAFAKGNEIEPKGKILKLKKGFEKHQRNYLIFLRVVPVFPGGLISIACVMFKVPFWRFLWTTVLGWAPASFLFTNLGIGFGSILESGEPISWNLVLNWNVMPYLILIGVFALLPILFARKKKKKAEEEFDA